jgi:hypothetical protein
MASHESEWYQESILNRELPGSASPRVRLLDDARLEIQI